MWGPPMTSFNEPFKDSDWNPAKFAVALYSCLFAYYGWYVETSIYIYQ